MKDTLNLEATDSPFDEVPETEIKSTSNPFDEAYNPFSEEVDTEISQEEVTEENQEDKTVVEKKVETFKAPQKTPASSKADVTVKIEAGKKILEYLAERKGIAADIDFEAIKTEDDIADFIEAIEEYDQTHALNQVKSADKNIGKIIDYLQAGGDKTKIANLLIEQQELTDVDLTTESGAKNILKAYYKNVVGYDDTTVDNKIKRLIDKGQLQEEAEDIKPLYDKNLQQRQDLLAKEAQAKQQQEQLALKQREGQFVKLLQDNKVSRTTAQGLYGVAFGQRELADGTKISELDYKFATMQKDPNQYLKLVEFMANPGEYDKKVLLNKNNTQVEEQHKKRLSFDNKKPLEQVEPRRETKQFKF